MFRRDTLHNGLPMTPLTHVTAAQRLTEWMSLRSVSIRIARWTTRMPSERRARGASMGGCLSAWLLLSCASTPPPAESCDALGPANALAFECSASATCRAHVDSIQALVYRTWRPARPLPQRGQVRIRFRLDDAGQLTCAEVVEATRGLATSSLAAFQAAELPPLPEDLRILSNVDLMATFRYERAY